MIIYIHGFGGCGDGVKASILRDILKPYGFMAPSLSYVPDLAIHTLEEIIESLIKYEDIHLIGSSLGGYYATYLADKYNLKAVLINPSTKPTVTLAKVKGTPPNFYDGSFFSWVDEHIEKLKKYDVKDEDIKSELYFLLTQTEDELLDYKLGVEKYKGGKMIVEEGGNHSYVGIETKVDEILKFLDIHQ
jgi:predicted esterase YcpF (UPF0227 family)